MVHFSSGKDYKEVTVLIRKLVRKVGGPGWRTGWQGRTK